MAPHPLPALRKTQRGKAWVPWPLTGVASRDWSSSPRAPGDLTCGGPWAPGGQAGWGGGTVEDAHILGSQELREAGTPEHVPLAAQQDTRLLGNIDDAACQEGDSHGEGVLGKRIRM